MKILLLSLVSLVSFGANVNSGKACISMAVDSVKDQDWTNHEEDFTGAVLVGQKHNENTHEYYVRVGYDVSSESERNSTYRATVTSLYNEVSGVGSTITCVVNSIAEIRNR